MLTGSDQNGTAAKKGDWVIQLSRITRLPADRKNLTHSVCEVKRGNPVQLPILGQCIARFTYGYAGVGGLQKRMLCCNDGDTG
jgi:hypothetical protein